jgi:1-acyl-sn-glycerol-3-phosphate acyltransferase
MSYLKSILAWSAGVLFMILFFPFAVIVWLIVLPFDPKRAIIHRMLNWHGVIVARLLPFWKIEISGRERAVKGQTYVIISNHQSSIDTFILCCLRYRYRWISKVENLKVPFIGWYIRMAKYITVNRGNEESKAEMMEKALRCLREGISIMIFPEGTRSPGPGIGFFKRGAFRLAIEANVPILPVVLDGSRNILPKHGFVVGSGHRVKLNVLEPLHPEDFGTENPDELALRFSNLMSAELNKMRDK